MTEELLEKKIERQRRQIELLEQLIEDRSRDIYQAEQELRRTERELIDASRRAGMADVATSVLHNVGNALNSVNVSASVLASIAKGSKASGVGKAVTLLRAQSDPGRFLTEDPRGKKLLDYLEAVAQQIDVERARHADEITALMQNIEHIRAIIMAQQSLARSGPLVATISVRKKIADVIRMAGGAITNHPIEVSSDFSGLGIDEMTVDRHKLFQILLNLLTNAAHALRPRSSDRRLGIRVFGEGERVVFEVKDNGVGISAENLPKIFAHGFTTKSDGHGFGLHSCANAAREMGGRLEASSPGPGLGATFTLVLPRDATSACRREAASASP